MAAIDYMMFMDELFDEIQSAHPDHDPELIHSFMDKQEETDGELSLDAYNVQLHQPKSQQ